MKKKTTTNAVDILHKRYIGGDAERKAALEAERVNAHVARLIHDLRTDAGLSQQQLADMIGTTQSVISRLEDTNYGGHSLSMLNRIASALNRDLTLTMTVRESAPASYKHSPGGKAARGKSRQQPSKWPERIDKKKSDPDEKGNAFTEKEQICLKLFCRNCDQIKNSRFFTVCKEMNHSYSGHLEPDGSWEHTTPTYDQDDMIAFLTFFRKLFLDNEPNIFRVLNILKKDATNEEIKTLRQIKKDLQMMEKSFGGITISAGKLGERQVFTPKRTTDIMFNAHIFHSDPEKQQDLQKLWRSWPVIEVFFVSYLLRLSALCVYVSEKIKLRGYVQSEDLLQ
jgi:transcriptional regulator with XRE-family HTH domain